MSLITLEELKEYLRVDESDEDSLIVSLYDFAKEEIHHSTGISEETLTEDIKNLYKMAIRVIVTDRYENRGSSDQSFVLNNVLSSIYTKLKLVEDYD